MDHASTAWSRLRKMKAPTTHISRTNLVAVDDVKGRASDVVGQAVEA